MTATTWEGIGTMILAAGVILLQLSGILPGKSAKTTAPPAVPAENSASEILPLSVRNINLTNLNFAGASNPSGTTKMIPVDATSASTPIALIQIASIRKKNRDVIRTEGSDSRRCWLLLAAAQHGAAAFDAYSTRYAVGHGAVEQNPMLRPFARSDSIYAVSQIVPTVLDLVGRRMQRSPNHFVRRMWWLPQTLSTGTYIWAGTHNLQVANQP